MERSEMGRGAGMTHYQNQDSRARRSDRLPLVILALVVVNFSLITSTGRAQNWFYWDTSGNTAAFGGSGNWTAPGVWFVAPSGPHAAWSNGNDAIFSGTPGTVALNQAVT